MVKTPSSMLALGTQAPRFCLNAIQNNQPITLDEQGRFIATVVMFICNHCPYVKHANAGIIALANDYLPKNIQFIAINANDASQYPDDSPEQMKQAAQTLGYPFPYLYDETQEVAKAYQATCTPDFYVFDQQLSLVYRGQLDDSRPGNQLPVFMLSFSFLTPSTAASFPKGCESKNFKFENHKLSLNETGEQRLFLLFNQASTPISLQRNAISDVIMSPSLLVKLEPGSWAAFASDIPHLTFECRTTHNEQTSLVDCGQAIAICEYPRAKFALSNMGNYWVSANKPQRDIVNDAASKGIYLHW